MGQEQSLVAALLLCLPSQPPVLLHTQGLPILPPSSPPELSPYSALLLCALMPAVFSAWKATPSSPALQTPAGLPSGLSAQAAPGNPSSAPCPSACALFVLAACPLDGQMAVALWWSVWLSP